MGEPKTAKVRKVKKRKKEKRSSLLLILLLSGGGVAVLATVLVLILINRNSGSTPSKDKGGDPPPAQKSPDKEKKKPGEPIAAQISILPKVKGKDPLTAAGKLKDAIADTDALDPDWRLADIEAKRKVLEPEDNGAVQVITAGRLLPEKWSIPKDTFPLDPFPPHQSFSDAQVKATRREVTKFEAVLAEARQMSRFAEGRFRLEYKPDHVSTLMPHIQHVHRVAVLLAFDALLQAQDGNAEPAVASALALLGAVRTLDDEPIPLTVMVRVALYAEVFSVVERTLTLKKGPSEQSLIMLQRLLEQEAGKPLAEQFYRFDRAGFHYLLTNVANGDATLPGGKQPTADDHAWYLDYMKKLIAAAGEPQAKSAKKFSELIGLAPKAPGVIKAVLPAVDKVNKACYSGMARLRAAAIGLAVERYRLENGRWPASLDDLVPKHIGALPLDPYNGQPFKLAQQKEGVAIYCVPVGGTDQRGAFAGMNANQAPANQGFRLLDEKLRR